MQPLDGPASLSARRAAYGTVSAALARLGDRELAGLVAAATPLGTGIGGRSALLEVAGTRVFVKRVPLTSLELRPEHFRSTANLFGLPMVCQYGVGYAPGFGAWRELAAHEATSGWVLAGECPNFPVLYGWRVLPERVPPPLPPELADVGRAVAFWDGAAGVRRRIEALRDSPASLTLFLEHVPYSLDDRLTARAAAGPQEVDGAWSLIDRELASAVAFLNARGLHHFDAHFGNVLTDGHRLYLTDFGLALSADFALSAEESAFLALHEAYDACYTRSWLVNRLITTLWGHRRAPRESLIRALASGAPPPPAPPAARALLTRYARVAALMTAFYGSVLDGAHATPYPAEALREALEASP